MSHLVLHAYNPRPLDNIVSLWPARVASETLSQKTNWPEPETTCARLSPPSPLSTIAFASQGMLRVGSLPTPPLTAVYDDPFVSELKNHGCGLHGQHQLPSRHGGKHMNDLVAVDTRCSAMLTSCHGADSWQWGNGSINEDQTRRAEQCPGVYLSNIVEKWTGKKDKVSLTKTPKPDHKEVREWANKWKLLSLWEPVESRGASSGHAVNCQASSMLLLEVPCSEMEAPQSSRAVGDPNPLLPLWGPAGGSPMQSSRPKSKAFPLCNVSEGDVQIGLTNQR